MNEYGRAFGGIPPSHVITGRATGWPLVGALLLLEASLCLTLLALYKKDQTPWEQFLWSNSGCALLVGIVGLCGATATLGHVFHRSSGGSRKEIYLTITMNATFLLIVGVAGELMVRMVKTQTLDGREHVRERVLLPKDWERTRRHYQDVVNRASGDLTYFVYDAQLGWVVADGRQSANGLYRSGRNGVRTREAGELIERQPGRKLIALVGDSFTFGEEVSYDDTWAVHLQRALGNEFQVVNFGVPGYGVDQIYLRYLRDVPAWKPDIVVFGFISNDLVRSMIIYTFLSFPEWDSPYSKPRFVHTPGGLRLINSPTIRPKEVFSTRDITDLPALAHDAGYREFEWVREWVHKSDLVRFIQARFPRWERLNDRPSDESIVALNRGVITMFLDHVSDRGGTPLLVYLPSSEDFWPDRDTPTLGRVFVNTLSKPYVDPMPCLIEVPASQRFVPGNGHYSALGNAAVAKCLASQIRQHTSTH